MNPLGTTLAATALCALTAAQAAADDPLYPAAQCAAWWLGRDDVARRSALLEADPTDPDRALAFRAVAVRLNGGDAGPVDAFIRRERAAMDRLVRAAIHGDPTSIDLQERLLRTCDAFAATQDETRALR